MEKPEVEAKTKTKPKAAILGHSFVRRLSFFCEANNKQNMDIEEYENFSLVGYSGAKVHKILHILNNCSSFGFSPIEKQLRGCDIVIIHIGENDITSNTVNAKKLADDVLWIARTLITSFVVKRVIIGQLMKRKQGRYSLPCSFNAITESVNARLEFLCEFFKKIDFLKHKGFSLNWDMYLCEDGTHLNDKGMTRYYRSLRGSLLRELE